MYFSLFPVREERKDEIKRRPELKNLILKEEKSII